MSFTNNIENKILKKLTGLEKVGSAQTGSAWAKPSTVAGNQPSSAANNSLQLKLFTTSPGESGSKSGLVATNLFKLPFGQFSIGPSSATFTPQIPNVDPADRDQLQYFRFDNETAADVTSVGLLDSNMDVIWYESLAGSAVRKYTNLDQLRLTSITFGFDETAIGRDLASLILRHIFSSASADTFAEINTAYLTFYDGDPGFNGDSGIEVGLRVPLRSDTGQQQNQSIWEVVNGTASNTDMISTTFAASASVTHVAIRSNAVKGGANDSIYWRGALLSPQKLQANDTLAIRPGQLALSID